MIAVITNGGTVTIEKPVGANWVTSDTITEDGAYRIYVGDDKVRFTPSGGAHFQLS